MAKLLFTHSYFYRFDKKQWETKKPYPPYGTIYAAAWMRENGHEVALHDVNLLESPEGISAEIKKGKPDYLVIYDDGFNYLTKMCLTNMREAAFRMAEIAKENDCTVIVSSSDSTDHHEMYLQNDCDAVMLGEAELTLVDLVNAFENGDDISEIEGLATITNGQLKVTKRRAVIRELDSLPDPAWDLIDFKPYREIWESAHGYFELNMATTRGCPFKCNWCAKPIYGNRYNSRSPERVYSEMAMLVQKHGADRFWMCDDIFGLKKGWVKQFAELVEKGEIKFRYKIQSRVDLLLEEDTIGELVKSGLAEVWLGAESGSQEILDAMDKGTDLAHIYEATQQLKAQGVRVAFFLQFGYLGEEIKDIKATIDMVKELLPDDIGISVSYPLPGTKFYEKVQDLMTEKKNWTESDDLELMYPGRFPSAFYKVLHRHVHKEYRVSQAIASMKSLIGKSTISPNWRSVALLPYFLFGRMQTKRKLNAHLQEDRL